jgi:hypothetical protein
MNCQRVQDNFIDYQDGTLDAGESAALRTHLASCPTCQREWSALQEITRKLDSFPAAEEPSPRLREQFYAMLETHQRDADSVNPFALAKSRIDRFFAALMPATPALQFAGALAALAVGVFTGARYLSPAAPTPAPALAATTTSAADTARLARLEKQVVEQQSQMDEVNKLAMAALLQQKSTSERIQNVLATLDQDRPNEKVLTDLVAAMTIDPSVNVRLSAVEAVTPHVNDRIVRAGLIAALPRENAPLVQVAMIELLASIREVEAAPVFERLSRDESADQNVRDSARRGLAVLRSPSPTDTLKNNNPSQPVS